MDKKPEPKDFPPESPHDLEWGGYNHSKYSLALEQWEQRNIQTGNMVKPAIKNERDYAIRKGKVLEKFNADFFEKYMHNALYRNVYEALIRDADPYEIIEKLIDINTDQYQKIKELVELHGAPKIIAPTG